MAFTTSTKLGLYVPDSDELVDVAKINDNNSRLETAIGATIGTSSARVATTTPYPGQFWRESDTSRLYVHNGSSPASAGWSQVMSQGGTYLAAPGGSTATVRHVLSSGSAAANRALSFRGSADTVDHFEIDYDGAMQWGNGSGSMDTNLYRPGTSILKTDDQFQAASAFFTVGKLLTEAWQMPLSGSVTSTSTSMTDLAGTSKTITTSRNNAVIIAYVAADYSLAATGAATITSAVVVNGTWQTQAQAIWNPSSAATVGARATVASGFYIGTLATAGNHTIKMQHQRVGGASGSFTITLTTTSLSFAVFE